MAIEERENDWFKFYYATYYKKSPFHRRAVEAGCTSWDLYNHMLIPTLYDDDVKEYWHLVEKVTLWDVAVERQLEITGPDAARFTQLLTPRDLSQTRPEQCKYVLICAPDGGIINDPILLKLAEDHFWLSLADSDALLYALGVQAFAGMDVEIGEPDVSPLQIQGPRSKPLIRKLFGDDVADQKYYWHKQTELDGIPLVVSRTGWSAELGYEVYLRDGTRAHDLWNAIVAAGEEFELRAIAPSDQRRMEAGIFNYGNDMASPGSWWVSRSTANPSGCGSRTSGPSWTTGWRWAGSSAPPTRRASSSTWASPGCRSPRPPRARGSRSPPPRDR